jgi:hypothetical protein
MTARVRDGSTSSQLAAPTKDKTAAAKKEAVQPKWSAIQGVKDAVTAPPNCAPIFMKPETEPEE